MILLPAIVIAVAVAQPADTSLRLARDGVVQIDSRVRDVTVHLGTDDRVLVRGSARIGRDGVALRVQAGFANADEIEITVPAWSRVEVNSYTGDLTFDGTPASLHATTVSGDIHVHNGVGTLSLESVAGTITVDGFHGVRLSLDATNDDITVDHASGEIDADNLNGAIALSDIRSSAVNASSTNGSIRFEGAIRPDGRYQFSTQNDDITLELRGEIDARIHASTVRGDIRNTIPVASERRDRDGNDEHSRVFTFGNGSARITAETFNGDVIVRRAN